MNSHRLYGFTQKVILLPSVATDEICGINPAVVKKILSYPFILLVKIYQLVVSPLLPMNCRHTPTCSQYTIEAIREWGPLKGIWLGIKRLSKCHPWGTHGYDPVPRKEQ